MTIHTVLKREREDRFDILVDFLFILYSILIDKFELYDDINKVHLKFKNLKLCHN